MASAAAADPATMNVKSTEPLEPVGASHEPQNGTDSTGSQPPSVGLKGERNRATSPCIEDSKGGQRDERARGSAAPSSNGENATLDSTPPPSTTSRHTPNDDTTVTSHRHAERLHEMSQWWQRLQLQQGLRRQPWQRPHDEGTPGNGSNNRTNNSSVCSNDCNGSGGSGSGDSTSADKSDAAETVQGYWRSVPEPLDTRMQGTEARTLTLCTVNTTRSPMRRELPYQVITLERSTLVMYTDIAAPQTQGVITDSRFLFTRLQEVF
ncbi:hypothetical protein PAXRUDRAFT_21363 [Paxillus rubicundulus Ve08.2h10]|uniref:Unplaced genomic scaffold scaffold_5409, whole genome shotgun sequence n=1 Tax=Paxillus rubicundulus Ve08.2h10 TaxID=930991 RepID=A0A0D0CZT0_9AGAM|nr:hypothetical protein PAXRUDRAFT_21363 [Paxillus rubicundulus Ve08.2h10]